MCLRCHMNKYGSIAKRHLMTKLLNRRKITSVTIFSQEASHRMKKEKKLPTVSADQFASHLLFPFFVFYSFICFRFCAVILASGPLIVIFPSPSSILFTANVCVCVCSFGKYTTDFHVKFHVIFHRSSCSLNWRIQFFTKTPYTKHAHSNRKINHFHIDKVLFFYSCVFFSPFAWDIQEQQWIYIFILNGSKSIAVC